MRAQLLAAAVVAGAMPAAAFDLSEVKIRTLFGLDGPASGHAISNQVLGVTSLAAEGTESLAGRALRTRYWTIGGEGGIVPNHDHSNRPAAFVILTGEIYEYRSDTPERILHQVDGLALEEGELAHWWLNEASEPVRLIAFDVFQAEQDIAAVEVAAVPQSPAAALPEDRDADLALLGAVDIGAHFDGVYGDGLVLSLYRADIAPGGVLADFTAAGEPLQSFVWRGAVTEHRSDAAAPVALSREAGSTFTEGATGHWQNDGDAPAVLYFGVVEPATEIEGVPRVGILAHGVHPS